MHLKKTIIHFSKRSKMQKKENKKQQQQNTKKFNKKKKITKNPAYLENSIQKCFRAL